ncbi:hypothetical protein AURDEDRAFT_131325 [Auricularia subglabra TFB-10046 SS5]|uniref:BRCT domain-containing protein n=1 Tax=Auricularia subglabra (strain TFB-10046 / SS5) TaxID=717982 RepID=J0CUT9_AURST|nr:hypothetical protein AURDEDRAFT_131325 [Auricularia subglabra TFB-10046 SS5]
MASSSQQKKKKGGVPAFLRGRTLYFDGLVYCRDDEKEQRADLIYMTESMGGTIILNVDRADFIVGDVSRTRLTANMIVSEGEIVRHDFIEIMYTAREVPDIRRYTMDRAAVNPFPKRKVSFGKDVVVQLSDWAGFGEDTDDEAGEPRGDEKDARDRTPPLGEDGRAGAEDEDDEARAASPQGEGAAPPAAQREHPVTALEKKSEGRGGSANGTNAKDGAGVQPELEPGRGKERGKKGGGKLVATKGRRSRPERAADLAESSESPELRRLTRSTGKTDEKKKDGEDETEKPQNADKKRLAAEGHIAEEKGQSKATATAKTDPKACPIPDFQVPTTYAFQFEAVRDWATKMATWAGSYAVDEKRTARCGKKFLESVGKMMARVGRLTEEQAPEGVSPSSVYTATKKLDAFKTAVEEHAAMGLEYASEMDIKIWSAKELDAMLADARKRYRAQKQRLRVLTEGDKDAKEVEATGSEDEEDDDDDEDDEDEVDELESEDEEGPARGQGKSAGSPNNGSGGRKAGEKKRKGVDGERDVEGDEGEPASKKRKTQK